MSGFSDMFCMNRLYRIEGDPSTPALRPPLRMTKGDLLPSPRGEGGAKRRMRWLSAELLFYIGFIPFLWVLFWRTSDFPQIGQLETLSMLFFGVCVALKMLLFDAWKLWEILLFVLCVGVAGLSYYKSTFLRPLVIVIAIYGARGLDGRKILKVWLVMSVMNIILTLSAAGLGLIRNFKMEWDDKWALTDTKNSLGFIYSTDCAARFFFTSLVYFYLRGEKLRWFEYLIFTAMALILFRYTGGRIDSGCILITAGLFGIVNLGKKMMRGRTGFMTRADRFLTAAKKVIAFGAMISLPAAAVVTLLLCRIYRPSGILQKLNEWMSTRLEIGHQTFEDNPITLFGTFIKMYGNGDGENYHYIEGASYNFIDISYQNVLMLYGLVFFLLLLGLFIWLAWRRRCDTYLMLCIIMIAANCMIAHHLTELAYIPFTMLVFARDDKNVITTEEFPWTYRKPKTPRSISLSTPRRMMKSRSISETSSTT